MEIYPSINTDIINTHIFAFDKLDGSNIRAEWTRKNGLVKFGTRRRLLDANEQPLGEAVGLIQEGYAEELDRIFRKQKLMKATAFFEFYGDSSFAGLHSPDEPHQVRLIEVHHYKQGIVSPQDFLKTYASRVPTADLLYQGKPNQDFIRSVKNGTLEGMTFEGVVCKGGQDSRNRRILFKVKNQAWLQKLREVYKGDEKKIQELA